jgi:GT2 family glycosyltransferase
MCQISVIVPNWNGVRFLPICLDSLERQSLTNFEVVLVDNGSTDESVSFVRDRYPKVKLLLLEKNHGFAYAVNAGIKTSTSNFIALLNNDAKAHPYWLANLYRALNEHPDIGFCASKILFFDQPNVINAAGDAFAPWHSPRNIGLGRIDSGQYENFRQIFGACAAASMYRRSMFDDVGLFDEDFWAYYEDVDISFRGQLCGYKCLYVPDAVVFHVGSGTAGHLSPRVVYFLRRNFIFLIVKNMPFKILLKYLFPTVGLQIGLDIMFLFKGHCGPVLNARLDAIKGLSKMWRKRKQIQHDRRVTDVYLESLFKAYER